MSSEKDTQISAVTTPSGVATSTTTTANRNRNRRKANKDGTDSVTTVTTIARTKGSNFKGHTADMNGHVFQLFSESGSEKQYQRTLDMLCEYIRKMANIRTIWYPLVKKLVITVIPKPTPIDAKADATDKEMFSLECKDCYKRMKQFEKNLKSIYAVIWGQCSLNMQGQLKSVVKKC